MCVYMYIYIYIYTCMYIYIYIRTYIGGACQALPLVTMEHPSRIAVMRWRRVGERGKVGRLDKVGETDKMEKVGRGWLMGIGL